MRNRADEQSATRQPPISWPIGGSPGFRKKPAFSALYVTLENIAVLGDDPVVGLPP
jgi:hypothetical protein